MNEMLKHPEKFDAAGMHTLEVIAKASRFNKWMYSEIKPFLKGNVLEIGSGIGNISRYIIEDGYTISLSDYNPDYCRILTADFSGKANVKAIHSIDLLHPAFELHYSHLKERFDCIILLNVIEHIADDKKAISNCRFLLTSGGHLIFLAPAYKWLFCNLDKNLGHYRRYTLRTMKKIFLSKKILVVHSQYFNLLGILGWLLFGKIFRKKVIGNEMKSFNAMVPVAKRIDKLILKKAGLSIIVVGKKPTEQ